MPSRFLLFVLVGVTGVSVHFAVLSFLFKGLAVPFWAAQTCAALIGTSNNFFLNNIITYYDQQLVGRRLVAGWLTFNLIYAVGSIGNVAVATWLFENQFFWVHSALAGIAIATVWNYVMTSIMTWRAPADKERSPRKLERG